MVMDGTNWNEGPLSIRFAATRPYRRGDGERADDEDVDNDGSVPRHGFTLTYAELSCCEAVTVIFRQIKAFINIIDRICY